MSAPIVGVAQVGYVGHVFVDVPTAQRPEGDATHAICARCGSHRRVVKGADAAEYTADTAPHAATRWSRDRFRCPDPLGARPRR